MVLKSINPTTGKLIKEYKEWDDKRVYDELENCKNAFYKWRETSLDKRVELVNKIRKVLYENKIEYSNLMTIEMGKPIKQAEAEIDKCIWLCNYYTENAKDFLNNEKIKTDANLSYIQFSPIGLWSCIRINYY